MDAAGHYRHLIALGREEFLAASAPAALVRYPSRMLAASDPDEHTRAFDETLDMSSAPAHASATDALEVFPLVKKPGASFPDRITIGRTQNNDIEVADHSISRFHAYIRQAGAAWVVADAGSKNGSWLRGAALEPRREQPLQSKTMLRLGEVDLTFFIAGDLYEALGGS